MDNQARWHLVFRGSVQHVGFRYTAMYFSRDLYITGWVRNLDDGSVEMEAQGSLANLRKFLLRLKGAVHIHIESVDIKEIPLLPHDRKFRVL